LSKHRNALRNSRGATEMNIEKEKNTYSLTGRIEKTVTVLT
jgi:hypothetical protein